MFIISYICRKITHRNIIKIHHQQDDVSPYSRMVNMISHEQHNYKDKNDDDKKIMDNVKIKISDMKILEDDEIENIKKMSYISLLEIVIMLAKYNNYMIDFFTNDSHEYYHEKIHKIDSLEINY